MAQVKKFQNPAGPLDGTTATNPAGNSVEVNKKYGRWIKNGVIYEMDEEKMKDLERHIMSMDPSLQPYAAEDFKRLQNGEDITIDTMLNQRDGIDDYAVLNDRQEKRLQNGKVKEGILNSLFNTPTHKFNKATYELGKWDPSKITSSNAKSIDPEKEILGKWTGDEFKYQSLEDGTYRFQDIFNRDNLEYFDKMAAYLSGSDEDRAKYNTSNWSELNNILSWYQDLKNDSGESIGKLWMDALREAIVNGTKLNQDQNNYLQMIGLRHNLIPNPEVIARQQEAAEAAAYNAAWANYAGTLWGNDARNNFTQNADGSFTLDTTKMFHGFDPTKNYFFNDEFLQLNPVGYDWLRNKIYFNGKWYSGDDLKNPNSDIYRILSSPQYDFFNKNKRGEYKAANDVMMTSWLGQDTLLPAQSETTAGYLGNFYQNPYLYESTNYNIKGAKYNNIDIDPSYIVRRYIDLRDTNPNNFLNDGTGRRRYKWLMTDAYGNIVTNFNNQPISNDLDYNRFSGLYNGSSSLNAQTITPVSRITTDKNSIFYNRYHKQILDSAGNVLIDAYLDPADVNTVHAALSPELGGDGENVFLNIPIQVYNAISSRGFLERLNARRDLKEKFVNLVGSKTSKRRQISVQELALLLDEEFRPYAQEIINYFRNHYLNPRTVKKPTFKKGGVIKAQSGIMVKHAGSTPTTMLQNAERINAEFSNPYKVRTVRQNGEWNVDNYLSNTDKLELLALITDGVGMVAGWLPVAGDITNALAGTTSNIMNYVVDRRRVKEGAAPKGTALKNLGIGVGIDLASIAPGIGDALNTVDWGRKLGKFLSKSKPFVDALTSVMMSVGLLNGVSAVQKVISGEDLTMDEMRELVYGLGSLTGLGGRLGRHFSDARLAANSQPDVQQVTRTTKYKTEDGVEKSVALSEIDVNELTAFKNRGDSKSKKLLTDKLKEYGVPEEEINRILNSPEALKQLGLTREVPSIGRTHYSAVKPEKKRKTTYYFTRDRVRNETLSNRSNSDLVRGVNKDPKAAARWWDYSKNTPAGYRVDQTDGIGYSRIISVDSEPSTRPSVESEEPRASNMFPEPAEVQQVQTPQVSANPVLMTGYELATRLNRVTRNRNEFMQQFKDTLELPDFKAFAEDSPAKARAVINGAIYRYVKRVGLKGKKKTKLAENVDAMIKGYGYTFKEGGKILKARKGQWFRNIWGGLNNPEILNAIDSGTRFVLGDLYNSRSTDRTVNSIRNTVHLSKPITPTEYYTPNYINAGNAERQLAQSEFQYMPAVTNDIKDYQAWKKQGYDRGNLRLANAAQLDSQQTSQNLLRNIEELRNYAYNRAEGETQYNKAKGAGETAIAEALNVGDRSRVESLSQLIYQGQAQRDQYMNEALAYAKGRAEYDARTKAEADYQKAFDQTFGGKYDPTNVDHLKLNSSLRNHYINNSTRSIYDQQYNWMSKGGQRMYDRYIKSVKQGGSLRPTSEQIAINREKANDQIRINKAKSQDRQWENNQKEIRKAIEKMSDRVHDILMKILS